MSLFQVTKKQVIENYELRTMTGDIVSFTPSYSQLLPDPFSDLNVKCNVVATQSGSGTPYPAGGGKNKLNYDKWKTSAMTRGTAVWENNGVTITATSNDAFTQYMTPYFDAFISVSEGDSIWMSWEENTNKSGQVMIFTSRSGTWGLRAFINNSDAKSLHYTVTAEDEGQISFRFGVTNSGDTISYKNVQIEKGSEVTPFAPSANIRPISGYSSANITRCGKNVLPPYPNADTTVSDIHIVINNGHFTASGTTSGSLNYVYNSNKIRLKAGTYTLSFSGTMSSDCRFYARNYTDSQSLGQIYNGSNSMTFTFTEEKEFGVYLNVANAGISVNIDVYLQLELGSTPSAYTSYNGQSYTIAFGQTVYGGVLDVTRGKLHVTQGYVELADVNFTNFIAVSKMVYGAFPEGTKPATANDKANIICSHYQTVSRAEVGYSAPYTVTGIGIDPSGNIFVTSPDSSWASVSDAVADFNGVYMAYELATPFDIDLTPEVISAIVGENNVFADCGETTVTCLI